MDFIQKVVIVGDNVGIESVITINKYSNEVAAINELLEGINIGRGKANYSIIGSKFTFNFAGVGSNRLIAYVNGMAIEAGGINTITPFDDIIYPTSTMTTELYPSNSDMEKEIVISPRYNNTLRNVNLTNITLPSYFVKITNLRQDRSMIVHYGDVFITLLAGESLILEKLIVGVTIYRSTKIASIATDISFVSITSNGQDIYLTNQELNSSKRIVQLVWASEITSCNIFIQVGWPNKGNSIPDNFIFTIINPYYLPDKEDDIAKTATIKPWFDNEIGNEIPFNNGVSSVFLYPYKSLEFFNIGGGSPYIVRLS